MSNATGSIARNRILIAAALAGGSVIGSEFVALSPWGGFGFILWKMVVLFLALAFTVAAVVTFMCLLAGIALRWRRIFWLNLLVACVGSIFLLLAGVYISGMVREPQFIALSERSKLLVSAIEDYTNANGSPPSDLHALVPEYLAEIPKTDMGAYPEYRYMSPGPAGNPWAVRVNTPNGILDFDAFLYLPNGNYDENGFGVPKRMGDWAYIYE